MGTIATLISNPYRVFASLASKGKLLWVNEKTAVEMIYRGQMGRNIDLNNPKTFNEKLQWLKVNDHKKIYTSLVDKYEVKEYVKEWLGEEYVIPTLGMWNTVEEINFDSLPNQFVIKCTHDSGSAVVCRDKSSLDTENVKRRLKVRMTRSHYWSGREWPYKNVKPRIIAEKFMDSGNKDGLTDYKFYCFNGEPKFLYISTGLENHKTARISFFDLEGNILPFGRTDYKGFDTAPKMPSKLPEMIKIARECATKIPSDFIRVDLYQILEQIYFSEFTFTPCGGYMQFAPESYDEKIGNMLKLTEVNND